MVKNSSLNKREVNWVELIFAKTSGIVSRERQNNWPIADRRVPSYDPRNNCGRHFGTSSLFVSKVVNRSKQDKYDHIHGNLFDNKIYDECLLVALLLGRLRFHYSDGNENIKKQLVRISKTRTLNVHHAFLYISLPSQQDCDVKLPNFTFNRQRELTTTNLSYSF